MGIEKKNATIRMSLETRGRIERIREALHPFAGENLSDTVRFLADLVFALVFTPATIRDAFSFLQRLHCDSLQGDALQLCFAFPHNGQGTFYPRFGAQR